MQRLLILCCVVLAIPALAAGPHYGPWSAPESLGAAVNSGSNDYGAALSKDGLALYFTSDRPGGLGGEDLWLSRRSSPDEPFGAPTNLWMINTSTQDRTPALSRDGHWLFFASNRPGGLGALDIWASYREQTHDDFAWAAPVNLGTGINGALADTGPTYLAGDAWHRPKLYFARGASSATIDIWVSEETSDGGWADAVPVAELNTTVHDAGPEIRHDGLEILFHSNRSGSMDLWSATRGTTDDPFSTPVSLGEPPNAPGVFLDRDAGLSARGDAMILSSDRPGGAGLLDLYVSWRYKGQH